MSFPELGPCHAQNSKIDDCLGNSPIRVKLATTPWNFSSKLAVFE